MHSHEFHAWPAIECCVAHRLDGTDRFGLDQGPRRRLQPRLIAALEADHTGEAVGADCNRQLTCLALQGRVRPGLATNCEAEVVARAR
eukprot:scaffold23223_cov33-Tisochrysis_lutea.AAC.5